MSPIASRAVSTFGACVKPWSVLANRRWTTGTPAAASRSAIRSISAAKVSSAPVMMSADCSASASFSHRIAAMRSGSERRDASTKYVSLTKRWSGGEMCALRLADVPVDARDVGDGERCDERNGGEKKPAACASWQTVDRELPAGAFTADRDAPRIPAVRGAMLAHPDGNVVALLFRHRKLHLGARRHSPMLTTTAPTSEAMYFAMCASWAG